MKSVAKADTGPELIVRKILHGLGYRFRLHDRTLPGTPDLVFSKRRKAIFVNGCFWHRHSCHAGKSMPTTNVGFWKRKFDNNKRRDRKTRLQLRQLGWKVQTIWECEINESQNDLLLNKMQTFLQDKQYNFMSKE
jgi:DNA mismatch endonuclease, patch repair protein